jgi:hypothetical protein
VERGIGITRVEALRAYDDDRLDENEGGRMVAIEMKRSSQTILFELGNRAAGGGPPSWAGVRRVDRGQGAVCALATGWPLRCLAARAEGRQRAYTAPSMAEVSGAARIRPAPASSLMRDLVRGVIPLSPLWAGLAGNSVLYAAVIAAALAAARAARGASRRRLGRCPTCGCDPGSRASAGCPECGRGRAASPTSG